MLDNTYIHISNIGVSTERMIWKSGIKSWNDFRKVFHEEGHPYEFIMLLNGGLKSSKIFSCLAFSKASLLHGYQSTGL